MTTNYEDSSATLGQAATPEDLRQSAQVTQEDLAQNVRELSDRVNPRTMLTRKANAVGGAMSGVRDRLMGTPRSMAETGEEVTSSMREKAQGNPLAAGAVALAMGWIAGGALPVSAAEKRKLADAEQKAVSELQKQAQPAIDKLNETVAP